MIGKAQLIGAILGLIGIAALGWFIHHRGYISGQAERIAYYAPLMQAANDAKIAADERAAKAERTANRITQELESDHAKQQAVLTSRVAAADARIAQLLRQHAASCAAGGGALPAVPASGGLAPGATASDERIRGASERIGAIAGRCEHDAAELAAWQAWYTRQRAAYEQALTERAEKEKAAPK